MRAMFTPFSLSLVSLAFSLVAFTAQAEETLEDAWNQALTVNHNLNSVRKLLRDQSNSLKLLNLHTYLTSNLKRVIEF